MGKRRLNILVVGATGSIGRHVVDEALRLGHGVRALVRDRSRARALGGDVELVVGDLTRPETLSAAVQGVDAIVFTHGSDGGGKFGAETVDYGGVRNVLNALGGHQTRIAMMTAIGVTNRNSSYNQATESGDWKRRSERLVRASGLPYTIVRPGWFDYNDADQHKLVLLQGDKRRSGTPRDGVIARRQIAAVLVRSLEEDEAIGKTFELIGEVGPEQQDFGRLFAALDADPEAALDAVRDEANMPLDREPRRVIDDLEKIRERTKISA